MGAVGCALDAVSANRPFLVPTSTRGSDCIVVIMHLRRIPCPGIIGRSFWAAGHAIGGRCRGPDQPSVTTMVVAAARTTTFTMPPTRTKSPKR